MQPCLKKLCKDEVVAGTTVAAEKGDEGKDAEVGVVEHMH